MRNSMLAKGDSKVDHLSVNLSSVSGAVAFNNLELASNLLRYNSIASTHIEIVDPIVQLVDSRKFAKAFASAKSRALDSEKLSLLKRLNTDRRTMGLG